MSGEMDWSEENRKPLIGVIGAGAVGAYYGARLAHARQDVHFLMRSDAPLVRERGLRIESYQGDFAIPPGQIHVYDDPAKMPKADLVLVALKATSNHLLPALVSPLVKDDTVLVTMQNGLGNEEDLADLFGAERVMGGMAFICNNRVSPGVIRHLSEGWVRLGEFNGRPQPRTHRICRMFEAAGVECRVIEDLRHGRWEKILWNLPFNGLGALMLATTDKLIATAEGLEMVTALMREAMAIAGSLGLNWPERWIPDKIAMTRRMGAYKTSMQIDRERSRPLEIEAIVGRPLKVARERGVPSPRIEMLYRMLTLLWRGSQANEANSAGCSNLSEERGTR
jgi:2-dehydropantoate 2-reductase